MLWILQNYVVSLLRDKGGAIGALFNSMASCLGDAPNCNTGTF